MEPLVTRWLTGLNAVAPEAWDRLLAPGDRPLLTWAWLVHLEDSGSVAPEAGWTPAHWTLWEGERLVAAAPVYLKDHSLGEFVFDQAFAQAALDAGLPYYPKLVAMVPLTPVPAWRVLADPEKGPTFQAAAGARFWADLESRRTEEGLFTVQVNYPARGLSPGSDTSAWALWRHQGFTWVRPDPLETWDTFLGRFDKNQRRNIRREWDSVTGLAWDWRGGTDLAAPDLRRMGQLYAAHNDQFGPWAARFLTPDWFEDYPLKRLGAATWLSQARDPGSGDLLGQAFFLEGDGRLLGRYWGGAPLKNLHFAQCYYHPLREALARGWSEFDPGMGSEHKIRRGFSAVEHQSWHRFAEHRFQAWFARHLERFNRQTLGLIDELNRLRPLAERRP